MKKVTTLGTILRAVNSLGKSMESMELRITKATSSGFQAIENRLDALEKRVHATELGINRIETLYGKRLDRLETDMLSFRTALAKANIIKSKTSQE